MSSEVVIIATRNRGKVKEFERFFRQFGKEVKSLLDMDDVPDVEEDGQSFSENAVKKAVVVAKQLGVPVLADDSGLSVEVLGGAPGVYSARYAGEQADDSANNKKLLAELGQKKKLDLRTETAFDGEIVQLLSPASFICVLAYYDPAMDQLLEVEGRCRGWITSSPRGDGGFGYDPLFFVPELKRTMAELDPEEKNRISHRADAMNKLAQRLSTVFG